MSSESLENKNINITKLGIGSIITIQTKRGGLSKVRIAKHAEHGQLNNRGVIAFRLGCEHVESIKKRKMNLSPGTQVLEIHRGSEKKSWWERERKLSI